MPVSCALSKSAPQPREGEDRVGAKIGDNADFGSASRSRVSQALLKQVLSVKYNRLYSARSGSVKQAIGFQAEGSGFQPPTSANRRATPVIKNPTAQEE